MDARGILFAALAIMATLIGGTFYTVFSQAAVSHRAAVDRCHDAGGAWLASGPLSYSGTCLRRPDTPAWPPVRPAP